MNKNLYFDIKTVARLKQIKGKIKGKKPSTSKIVRTLIQKTPFDTMIGYLNEDMKLTGSVPLNRF